jgi:hypothetical protein
VSKPQTISLINTFNSAVAFDFVTAESKLTVTDALAGTVLQTLEKANRKEIALQIIFLVKRCNDMINVGSKLNDYQVATLASDILDFCQNETLEDIVMLFKMARKGELGNKIFRLDSMVIFQEWMPAYLEIKYQEKERALERERSERAKREMEINRKEISDENKKGLDKLIRKMVTNKKPDSLPLAKDDYLHNSEALNQKLKEEMQNMTVKELRKLEKGYSMRTSLKKYCVLVQEELKTRKRTLKAR